MKRTAFLILCFFSLSARSQRLQEEASKQITSLHAKGIDTIIQFDNEYFRILDRYNIQGLGPVMIAQETYLFYKLKGVGTVTKCIYYGDTTGEKTNAIALNPLTVNCDSMFQYVAANLARYKNEKIYPFIYKWKYDSDSSLGWLSSFHPRDICIVIDLANERYRKNLRLDDVEKTTYNAEVENLNYTYNSSTTIYKLYLMMHDLIEPIQRQFTYGRK